MLDAMVKLRRIRRRRAALISSPAGAAAAGEDWDFTSAAAGAGGASGSSILGAGGGGGALGAENSPGKHISGFLLLVQNVLVLPLELAHQEANDTSLARLDPDFSV